MEDCSIFTDKAQRPRQEDLIIPLGETYELWQQSLQYILQEYPEGIEEWNFPGKKYGWSFRIKDKKRAIAYFLPREGYFMIAFVFGNKAMEQVLESTVADDIKQRLLQARAYTEGRGIRIEVRHRDVLNDIYSLVKIKLAN